MIGNKNRNCIQSRLLCFCNLQGQFCHDICGEFGKTGIKALTHQGSCEIETGFEDFIPKWDHELIPTPYWFVILDYEMN